MTEERAQQLRQRLLTIGQEILQQRDVEIILKQVARAIREHSPFQLVAISLFQRAMDPTSRQKEHIAQMLTSGLSQEEEAKLRQLAKSGEFISCQQILEKGKALGSGYYVTPQMIPEIIPKGVKGRVGGESPEETWGAYDNLFFLLRQGPLIIGRISLADPAHGRVPTAEELEPLELFVNLATLALERAKHTQELNDFQKRLRGIYRLGENLAQVEDLNALIQQAVQTIREQFAYDHVTLFLKEGNALVRRGFHTRLPPEEIQFERFENLRLDQGICGWVAKHCQPALVGNVRQDPRYISGHPAIRSELAVPIDGADELIGVLNIESIQEDAFTPEDLELLQVLARQLATAISGLRHRQHLQEAMRQQEWVTSFLQKINRSQNLDEMLELIIQHGISLLVPKADAGSFLLWNDAKEVFEFRAAVNRDLKLLQQCPLKREEMLQVVVHARQPVIYTKTMQLRHPHLKRIAEQTGLLPPASTISVPIHEKDELVALFNINNLHQEGIFTEEDVRKLEALFPEIELALSRARDHERLQELALRDSLTGVYNRHYFTEFIHKEQERAQRYNYPISLVMMDMDEFYEINDRFGHVEGDRVLHEVAQLLMDNVRTPDTVVRYGGDEFIILMPQTTRDEAEEAMERLRKRLEKWNTKLFGLKISISFGVDSWTPGGQKSLAQVLENADEFMYHRRRARSQARRARKQVIIAAARTRTNSNKKPKKR